MDPFSAQLDGLFLSLSDPTRRAVLARLGEGPASVSELAQPFDIALPSFMKHVRLLEKCEQRVLGESRPPTAAPSSRRSAREDAHSLPDRQRSKNERC